MAKGMVGKNVSQWALFSLLVVSILLFGSISGLGDTGSDSAAQLQAINEKTYSPDYTKLAYPGNVSEIANGEKSFALDMYREISGDEGNIFFSPWSVYSALAMTYEGARGKTADEMHSVMHFTNNDSMRRQSFASLYDRFNGNSGYVLSSANALWVQKDYPLLSEYTAIADRYYHGKATNVDFIGSPENSRQTINSWVEEKTNDKIKDLIPTGSLDPLTRLVLTNAIYFKGTWADEFDKNESYNGSFGTGDGRTIEVPMMRRTGYYAYMETEDYQILRMPYEGNNISMMIILPKKDDGISSLEGSLSSEKLAEWEQGLDQASHRIEVNVSIPKFSFDTKYFISKNLGSMGMRTAFSDGADFSGMDGRKDLFISEVIHQAFIDVNEEGTEAAASTAVSVLTLSIPLPIPAFLADHPFLFMIQDKETGLIMFIGRVSNPSDE